MNNKTVASKFKTLFTIHTMFFIISIAGIFTTSCGRNRDSSQIVTHFALKSGYDLNELGINQSAFFQEQKNINFCYSSGYYFISDRINNKLLKVTESGKILLTIYNKDNYPLLSDSHYTSESDLTDSVVDFLILYSSYPLNSPGLITSDSNKNIYVINDDLESRKLRNNTVEDQLILKFNTYGTFLYNIGRKGINTEPFGYISHISNDNGNNLIVIEKNRDAFSIYKFSDEGKLLSVSDLTLKSIPILKNETQFERSFIDIKPGYMNDEVYITAQFTSKKTTMMLETYAIEYEKIFLYSLKTNKVEKMILKFLPEYEDLSRFKVNRVIMDLYGNKQSVQLPMKTLCGVDDLKQFYFFQRDIPLDTITAHNHHLFRYYDSGRINMTKYASFGNNSIFIPSYYITRDGKMLTYIITEDEIKFVSIR